MKFLGAVVTLAWLTSCLLAQTPSEPAPSASTTDTLGSTTSTITEPAITDVDTLFRTADVVALVKIVSGDTEHYPSAVYKVKVVQAFKGSVAGETLYIGPYVGERLVWEYIVFLRATPELLKPVSASETALTYGPLRYLKIFNEGYTSMETKYECSFEGESVAQKCDYAVRVCTDYVKTPKSLEVAPPLDTDTPFGCRWARRQQFLALLHNLSVPKR